MATIERFEDLEVWRLSRTLASKVYRLTNAKPFAMDAGLRVQIQRAVVSIASNIAEGFERRSSNQFLQFLEIAIGSASEVRSQLYIALDLGYITQEQFQSTYEDVCGVGKMLTRLMQYLRTTPNRQPSATIKPSNHQTIKPSNHQTINSSSATTIKPSNHQTIKP